MMPPPEAWVAICFICFLGLLGYLGVHTKLTGVLDQRQGRIKAELDEAARLHKEAQDLLAEFERKGLGFVVAAGIVYHQHLVGHWLQPGNRAEAFPEMG